MNKKIWIFHHYADPPDGHWTGTYDLYKFLVRKGYRITVFSSSFSHYSRKDPRLKPHEKHREQNFGGMQFVFVKTYPYARNDWRRVLNMLTYAFRAYGIASRRTEEPDYIIGSTPHPFCALAGLTLARKKGIPFYLELHDLWLQYLLDTKRLGAHNPVSMGLLYLDKLLYRGAVNIFALWPKMHEYVEQLGISRDKIVWMPLGVDFESLGAVPDSKAGPSAGPAGSFTIMCAARFGPESNIDEILKAAKILRDGGKEWIRFKLFGAGPEEERLRKYREEHNLTNVVFAGLVPKEDIPRYLKEADACIAGLPDVPTYRKYGTIPTKVLDYLSSNRPIIFITSLEKSLVHEAGSGLIVPPGNPEALARAAVSLAERSPEERARMGENGINYLREHHDLKLIAERLESCLR